MSLSDITEKIIKEAQKKAQQLSKEAETQVVSIEEETKKIIVQKKQTHTESVKKVLEDNKKRVSASANYETKRSLESRKRTELDNVFGDALKKFESLDDDAYYKILISVLGNLPKDISGTVYAPTKRLSVTKRALREIGLDIEITKDDTISGGVIVRETNAEYNLTFTRKMEDTKKSLEIEVASILFS
jgi:V/A-type H+-transporting ATPase subunit E